jgi:hypothetical protein
MPEFRYNFEKLFYRTCTVCVDSIRGQQMKKSLGLSIILLSLFMLSLIAVPFSSGQTENIKVSNYTWYIDSAGLLDVAGEIENIGTTTYASVYLSAQMTTTTGDTQTTQTQAYVKDLLPNQKAPFYMSFFLQADQTTGVLPGVANVEVAVTQAPTTTSYLYQDIQVTSQQHSIGTTSDDKGVYWVTGTLKNTGTQTASDVRILGTFYDFTGKIIAIGGYTDTDPLSASLAAGASVNFKFGAYDTNETGVAANKQIASYSLLVQVSGPELHGTAPQITPGPTISSTVSPDGTASPSGSTTSNPSATQPGQTSNTSQGNNTIPDWLTPGVIVIVIVAAIAVAALTLKKRSPKIASKQ